jgi:transcriptional regulator with XRE-family HTH domain
MHEYGIGIAGTMTLGEKLKNIRAAKGFSLADLTKKTNFTSSFLSQVEKNKSNPSINSLIKIASALEVSMRTLFLDEENLKNYIIHENQRKTFVIKKDKVRVELLTPWRKDLNFEPMLAYFGIGGTTNTISAKGVFFCLVLQGKLELTIEEEVHVLTKGDSVYLNSPADHMWKNIAKTEVILFAVGMSQ